MQKSSKLKKNFPRTFKANFLIVSPWGIFSIFFFGVGGLIWIKRGGVRRGREGLIQKSWSAAAAPLPRRRRPWLSYCPLAKRTWPSWRVARQQHLVHWKGHRHHFVVDSQVKMIPLFDVPRTAFATGQGSRNRAGPCGYPRFSCSSFGRSRWDFGCAFLFWR